MTDELRRDVTAERGRVRDRFAEVSAALRPIRTVRASPQEREHVLSSVRVSTFKQLRVPVSRPVFFFFSILSSL